MARKRFHHRGHREEKGKVFTTEGTEFTEKGKAKALPQRTQSSQRRERQRLYHRGHRVHREEKGKGFTTEAAEEPQRQRRTPRIVEARETQEHRHECLCRRGGGIPRTWRSARGAPVNATGMRNTHTNRATRPEAPKCGAKETVGPLRSLLRRASGMTVLAVSERTKNIEGRLRARKRDYGG